MTDSLIDKLRENRETAPVAYTEFVLAYSKEEEDLYCFFEGDEDKRYYRIRIKQEFKNFTCGGKDNVKKVFKLINEHKEYNLANTLFFIDKDYSNEQKNSNIYVTPCYSIENFYTATEVLKNILINEFNLKELDKDFILIVEKFKMLQSKFHNELLFFNAWLACQSDLREKNGIKTYLSIDTKVKSYFEGIVKNKLSEIKNFDDLKKIDIIENTLFSNAPKIETQKLQKKIDEFKSKIDSCVFRGKFELRFMVSFLQQLKNEIGKQPSKSIFEKKQKCTFEFKYENVISTLSQYAITPDCLKEFIDENLQVA
jgi:hypothetical protein